MKKGYFCPNCHHSGPCKTKTPGSFPVEILLWIFFIIPGFIYSAWRASSKKKVCAECEYENLIPANSPKAVEMQSKAVV